MASLISAANARIRSHPVLNYVCSTHFWGPVSNFGIPVAAVMDTQKDPELISGKMTSALIVYSATFMRYSLAVTPKNYLLFGCHFVNECAQLTQGYRFLQYWSWGGRERALTQKHDSLTGAASDAPPMTNSTNVTGAQDMEDKGRQALDQAREKISK